MLLKDGRLRPLLRSVIYVVATLLVAALLAAAIFPVIGGALAHPAATFFVGELCFCTAAVGVAVILRRWLDRRSVASLGLSLRGPWYRPLAVGIFLGAAMPCLIFALDEAFGFSHVTSIASLGGGTAEIWRWIPVFVLVAFAEETSVRGYILQNLWEEWGIVPAAVVTSLLFAVIHLGNPNSQANVAFTIAGLLAFSVWQCVGIIWTRSLWLAVGVHFAWNLFEGPVLGFLVSGLSLGPSVIGQSIAGPGWFTGGPFGPEAGASCLVALAAGFAVLYWLHRRGAFATTIDEREAYALAGQT